jgi:hypothetical protein
MMYALLMYADPADTRAMSERALAEVVRKHAALRSELGAKGSCAVTASSAGGSRGEADAAHAAGP